MARFYPFTRQSSKDDITNRLAFYKHKNGKELGLSGKLALVLPSGTPPELPDAIGSFTGLRSLDISHNSLRDVTPRIASLQANLLELNASHNMLTDVSEVALLTALHSLDLSHNSLRPPNLIPLHALTSLKELHLSHNHLSSDDPNSEPTSPSESELHPRRASLGPTFLYPQTPSQPVRKLASAPPTISGDSLSSSPPPSLEIDTSMEGGTPAGTSPPRLTSSPIPLLLSPTPIHPESSTSHSLSPPRTPSPTPPESGLSSPTPANTPIPFPAPSPLPFPLNQSLHTLTFTSFVQLEVLILSSNHITTFPDVHALVSLAKLDLSQNQIVEVPVGIHTQLVNLKELNLQSNLIEKLPPMMKSLKKLLVDKNPLHPAFLVLAQNNDLLNQLQATPGNESPMPRSRSDSAIPPATVSPPVPIRSATPPNGFLSRIFRKDHSVENISPKGKSQPAQDDSAASATSSDPAQADSDATEPGNDGADEVQKKKRSISMPQSPLVRGVPASPLFGATPVLTFPSSPPGQPTATEVYLEFVKKLKQTQNLKSSIDSFVTRIKNRSLDPDDLQAALRDFVSNTHTTLSAHPLWRKASPNELQEAELHLQEYVLEHLYEHIFSARQEDKDKDREITRLIKRFYFITPEHLDIVVLREHEDIWHRAEQQLLQINSTRSVRSKMRCVVRMCRDLIAALARAQGDSLGADVLLPHLIFVILQANPPHLHSNIVYMTRFSESEASETIYYITQLVAALYFIEHIEASSLNIPHDEFHERMSEPRNPSRTNTPLLLPLRARSESGSETTITALDAPNLVEALEAKRKEFASLGQAEAAKWVTDNDSLLSQCVGLSREVLPTLPTVSPTHPLAPPPRFEGARLEDLRAVEIPQLFEDYQRLVTLFHLFRPSPIHPAPLLHIPPTTLSSSSSTSFPSSPSHTPRASPTNARGSPLPSPPASPQASPRSSPSSLLTFSSTPQ